MSPTLITGRPWRVILAFTVPLLLGNIVQQLYQFADSLVVGRHLGVDALAAVGATGGLVFLLLGFAQGVTNGFAIPTAQAFGAGDERAIRRSVAAGTGLTALVSIVLTVAAPLLSHAMLTALRTPTELIDQATIFAQVTFLGSAALMFFNYLSAIIRAIGDSRTPLVFLTIACVLNVVFVVFFVMGLDMGVAGAAFATVLAQALSVAMCLGYILWRLPLLHLRRDDWRALGTEISAALRLGLPMGFQASIIAIGALTVQVALNSLGTSAVAAYTAASRVDGLSVAFLMSLSLASSMYAAQNLGARRPDRIRRGVKEALWMALAASIVLGVLMIAFGAPVVRLFVGDGPDEVVSLAWRMLFVNGVSYWALGVLFVLRGTLQGIGYTLVPTVAGVIELAMRAIAAIVLGSLLGFVGVALSNPLAWLGAAVMLVPSWLRARTSLDDLPVAPVRMTETTAIRLAPDAEHPPITDTIPIIGVSASPMTGAVPVETVLTRTIRNRSWLKRRR
ncbi:MAG: MATE family efflux transporter [Microbacterium sp.]